MEEIAAGTSNFRQLAKTSSPAPIKLSDVVCHKSLRLTSGLSEFDVALGGGIVPGSILLVGGEPGVGKSTLLSIVCSKLADQGVKILYLSGEESCEQAAIRFKRMNLSLNIDFSRETILENFLQQIKDNRPHLIVIDSIQVMKSLNSDSAAGTTSQIKAVTMELVEALKPLNISALIVGHINKDGSLAGPKIMEHMVDGVFYFYADEFTPLRYFRSVKNRFGSTNEVGVFEFVNGTLEPMASCDDNISGHKLPAAGTAFTFTTEGSRSFAIKIEALTVENRYNGGKRISQGIEAQRLSMLIAIIEKCLGHDLGRHDIFINIVGKTGKYNNCFDLAVVMALLSSFYNMALSEETLYLGEVGLPGNIRTASHLFELSFDRFGFKKVVTANELPRLTKNSWKELTT